MLRSPSSRFGLARSIFATLLGAAVVGGSAVRAEAQRKAIDRLTASQIDSLRRLYRVRPPAIGRVTVTTFLGAPGTSLGSPSSSGAGTGDYFVGVGYQERTRYTSRPDGGTEVGMGMGDPEGTVALEVAASSFSTVRHDLMRVGALSFKLHRRDVQHFLFYAVGVENAISWGQGDGGTSIYGTFGHVFPLRGADDAPFGVLSTSVGIGNGRFRSESEVLRHRKAIGVFGGVGLRIISQVAAAADWTGQDLDIGLNIHPFPRRGLVGTIGVADVTRRAGNGPRLIMSIGYGFNGRLDRRKPSPEDLHAGIKTP